MPTLLEGVNEVLKKADVLDASGELTSLTDSARQSYVDMAVQSLNEAVDHLYSLAEIPKPTSLGEATITLATDDRDYALDANLIVLRRDYHLIDETNNHTIFILGEDGYRQIILGDLEQDDTGLPSSAAIRPTDGELFMDRIPTSNENGRIYKYRFEKDLELTTAASTFPFSATVFRAIVPAAAELWRFYRHNEFNQGLFDSSMARAARYLLRLPTRNTWMPGAPQKNLTDPFS